MSIQYLVLGFEPTWKRASSHNHQTRAPALFITFTDERWKKYEAQQLPKVSSQSSLYYHANLAKEMRSEYEAHSPREK